MRGVSTSLFISYFVFNVLANANSLALSSSKNNKQQTDLTQVQPSEQKTPSPIIQKPAEERSLDWDISISPLEPYFWLASTNADAELAGNQLPIDLDFFADAVDNMGQGMQLKLELHLFAQKNKWSIVLDPTRLKADSTQGFNNGVRTNSTFKMIDGKIGYEILPNLDLFLGVRYTSQDMRLHIKMADFYAKGEHKWWNPLLGGRYHYLLSDKWMLSSGIYWGGFKRGAGDDYTTSGNMLLNYQYNNWLSFNVGYRALRVNLETGSGVTQFKYKATYKGFLLGANLDFF